MKLVLFAATFCVSYYLASLVQTVFHRFFGHRPVLGKLHRVHVNGHHAQYAREMLSGRWIESERHITGYYAIPFMPIVCLAYCSLPGIYFIAHICALIFAVWWHVYLHRQYHVRGSWWERLDWFQEKRHLHFVHHQKPNKNFAIVEYSWDLMFGTFEDAVPLLIKPPQRRENKKENYENRIHRHERRARSQ